MRKLRKDWKRIIPLVLALVLCLSLCACGSKVELSAADVEAALDVIPGTLKMDTSGENVKSFTYVVEEVNAKELVDREYCRTAFATFAEDADNLYEDQYNVCKVIVALAIIDTLLVDENDDDDSDIVGHIESLLDIVCDGKTGKYNGWSVSTDVDQNSDSVTIRVH